MLAVQTCTIEIAIFSAAKPRTRHRTYGEGGGLFRMESNQTY